MSNPTTLRSIRRLYVTLVFSAAVQPVLLWALIATTAQQIVAIFSSMAIQLPGITKLVLALAIHRAAWFPLVVLVSLGIVAAGFVFYPRAESTRPFRWLVVLLGVELFAFLGMLFGLYLPIYRLMSNIE